MNKDLQMLFLLKLNKLFSPSEVNLPKEIKV